eukprot:808384-Pyramimonas_sp.AAC.1
MGHVEEDGNSAAPSAHVAPVGREGTGGRDGDSEPDVFGLGGGMDGSVEIAEAAADADGSMAVAAASTRGPMLQAARAHAGWRNVIQHDT